MQDILQATSDFEQWLGEFVDLQKDELKLKHEQMADRKDAFPFFRATYYRWAQVWKKKADALAVGPRVPSIGDLHIENFGTWRDAEGRLVWGVNDLDEADRLPWTHDLTRLAASIDIARPRFVTEVKLGAACRALLEGYHKNLVRGGRPFVLEEHFPHLRALALNVDRDPVKFWSKLEKLLDEPAVKPPRKAREALSRDLPESAEPPQFRTRFGVGLGSLGRPRFLALARSCGSMIAREAKAAAPAATKWLMGDDDDAEFATKLAARSARCPDPFYRPQRPWITRRLAPRVLRIDLGQLKHAGDMTALFTAMGGEIANLHLADRKAAKAVLAAFDRLPKDWLEDAGRDFARRMQADQKEWREGFRDKAT